MPAFYVPGNYAFDNYADLVAAIADWMNRGDLSGAVGSMVALAEARMRRELTPYFGEASATIVCTAGLGALPSDYGTARRVVYGTRPLDNVSSVAGLNVSNYVWSGQTFVATEPYAYSIEGGGLRVWPGIDTTVTMLYDQSIPALSSDTPYNAILTAHPDLYFHGAMMFAEGYVANDRRAALFKSLFDEALQSCKVYFTRQKFGSPLVPRVGFVP